MERSLGLKLVAVGAIIAVLLIALTFIGSLVGERQARRDGVARDIANSSSLAQQFTGPIILVPYEKTVRETKQDPNSQKTYIEERQVSGQLYFLPETFTLDGDMRTERRARGIYEARLYHANLKIASRFDLPAHYGIDSDLAAYHFGQPSLIMGISDIRGIENASTVSLNGGQVRLLPGTGTTLLGSGLHAPVGPLEGDQGARLELAMAITLQGTSEFLVTPLGRETRISLSSNWPYPNFTGEYLPAHRKITADGFTADWATTFFSTNFEEALGQCGMSSACKELYTRILGVSFVDPVDQYLKTDRAIKYALLFVSLTFAGFFLFEVLEKLAVHPIQYGLVGTALAAFYLLLLSLSEHIGFAPAYLISATSCVALIAFYIGCVLGSARRGLAFGVGLALLYGLLYGLLSADDYALLMGSLLFFALLTVVMVLTRRVDWFSLGRQRPSA
jgi:inner membrane protein